MFAEHPELRAIIEQASGLKFGRHPQGRAVPKSALVTAAGAEVVIDLRKLPAELQKALTLPRFLRADVRLDEASPETASVQAFLIAATGGGGKLAEPVAKAEVGDPLAAQIVHPRVAAERARPAAEFRALFPPAVLFQPIIPRGRSRQRLLVPPRRRAVTSGCCLMKRAARNSTALERAGVRQ